MSLVSKVTLDFAARGWLCGRHGSADKLVVAFDPDDKIEHLQSTTFAV